MLALLDWELATLGDPLADLGYLVATYTDAASRADGARALAGHAQPRASRPRASSSSATPSAAGERRRRSRWYEMLALWKAAVFCEGLYGRFLRGETADAVDGRPGRGRAGLLRAAAAQPARLTRRCRRGGPA